MNVNREPCESCRLLGRTIPWGFMFAAAVIALTPLGPGWQRASAYLTVVSLLMLAGSYVLNRLTPSRRKF